MNKKYFLVFFISVIIGFSFVFLDFYFRNPEINAEHIQKPSKEDIHSLPAQGKQYYYEGKINEAIVSYESALNNGGDFNLNAKNLYFLYKESGNLEKAVEYLHRIYENNNNDYYWVYKYGINLYLNGNYEQAEKVLEESLANLLLIEENDENSIENKMTDKDISLLSYFLGQVYFKKGEYQKAEYLYNKGIDLVSYLPLNYIGLAELYEQKQEYEKSIEYYQTALKRDSSLSNLHLDLARLFEIIKDEGLAYYYWNRSLATGNKTNYVSNKISELIKKYPELVDNEKQEKDLRRKDIKWIRVQDYFLDNKDIPQIRIGIVDNVEKAYFKSGYDFMIENEGKTIEGLRNEPYSIEYKEDTYLIYHNEKLISSMKSVEPLTLINKDRTHTFLLYDISYGAGYFWAGTEDRQYRGNMELYPVSSGEFNIINILNIEEYLFSVVPAEMPAWWPDEAIKAQSLAARTYALANLGKHKKGGYDLCDTVHCAAYNGVKSETNKTNQLIITTQGETIYYNNKPISAVFSSNSGGYSEKSEEIWGNKSRYLQGANNLINNEYQFPLEPYELEKWMFDEMKSFSNNSLFAGYNSYRWVKVLDADYFREKYNIKNLLDIIVVGRTEGGTVKKVIIKGEKDSREISGDSIRSSLGGLKSNRFTMDKIYSADNKLEKIIFYGSGWGHHVGMDQTGAAGMAAEGYNYQKIINHFYQETETRKVY